MTDKPNCYNCQWRQEVPGSVHSSCQHPKSGVDNSGGNAMAMLASIGRFGPAINLDEAIALNVQASPHGIMSGWFNWPYNFDPVWLEQCNGFETA